MNELKNKGSFHISPSKLEFDRQNPRLVAIDGLSKASDETVMKALVSDADIGELIRSITNNTYLSIEPLIVTKRGAIKSGNYRVLEGNRRLCSIKLLLDRDLAKQCRVSIPDEISSSVFKSLEEITVFEVDDEEEARAFIGFKHINGAHRWNSYAKAKFLVEWYEKEYDNGITIEDIAGRMGDEHSTVRSLIGGMLVLNQAEQEELFNVNDRTKNGPFGFSHLYTALNRPEYRNFIGLSKDWNHRPILTPVAAENLTSLQSVLYFIYGSKIDDVQSVISSQNPDLKRLGEVLDHSMGYKVLCASNDLDAAYEEVRPSSDVFQDALIIASLKVQDVLRKIGKFSSDEGDDLIETAVEMSENAESIAMLLKQKIQKKSK